MKLEIFRWCLVFFIAGLFSAKGYSQGDSYVVENEQNEEQARRFFVEMNLRYYPYQSFSQVNPSFPFKIGYPSYLADMIAVGAEGKIEGRRWNHFLNINYSIPSPVTSDNGMGRNILLRTAESSFSRLQMYYYFSLPLVTLGQLEARHGAAASILYESRDLNFFSGRNENNWDISSGFGPFLNLWYPITPMLAFEGKAHFLFYIPYMSYGQWESSLQGQDPVVANYYSFIYSTHWDAHLQVNPAGDLQLKIGYRKTDQVGFGNATPSFRLNDMVTYKLERFNEFYFGVVVKIGEN